MKTKLILLSMMISILAGSCGQGQQGSTSRLAYQADPASRLKLNYLGEARCVAEPTLVIREEPSPFAEDSGRRLSFNQTVLVLDTYEDPESGYVFAYIGSGWVDTRYMERAGSQDDDDSGGDPGSGGSCDIRYKGRYSARGYGSDTATPSVLSLIAWAEGLGNCYNYTFNYNSFPSFEAHPNKKVCAGSYCSTAAGRYQFLHATWKYLASKNGFTSFHPEYQDDGATALIEEKSIFDYDDEYTFDRFSVVMSTLGRVWASLPGSPYGQPTKTIEQAWKKYQRYVNE